MSLSELSTLFLCYVTTEREKVAIFRTKGDFRPIQLQRAAARYSPDLVRG